MFFLTQRPIYATPRVSNRSELRSLRWFGRRRRHDAAGFFGPAEPRRPRRAAGETGIAENRNTAVGAKRGQRQCRASTSTTIGIRRRGVLRRRPFHFDNPQSAEALSADLVRPVINTDHRRTPASDPNDNGRISPPKPISAWAPRALPMFPVLETYNLGRRREQAQVPVWELAIAAIRDEGRVSARNGVAAALFSHQTSRRLSARFSTDGQPSRQRVVSRRSVAAHLPRQLLAAQHRSTKILGIARRRRHPFSRCCNGPSILQTWCGVAGRFNSIKPYFDEDVPGSQRRAEQPPTRAGGQFRRTR